MMRIVITALALALIAAGLQAATLFVPDNYATIQTALDSAHTGDTIVVRPGVYLENIDFLGKDVTLRSEKGPTMTIIDGGQTGSVVVFTSGESRQAAIEGFTITNGMAAKGGGILCHLSSSPTIANNIVTGNSADWGGGIYSSHSIPAIHSNVITANAAISGGGLSFWISDAEMINNIVALNQADLGAAINCEIGSPQIVNNTITGNVAHYTCGGIRCISCDSIITNTIFYANTKPEIGLDYISLPFITYCDIEGGWPGTGNIDADPLLKEVALGDYHLTYPSPCRDGGDWSAPHLPAIDFEGDLRDPCGIPDIGADEFWTHLYYVGHVVPGAAGSVRLTATPDFTATLALGSGLFEPPRSTPYGDLYIKPPFLMFTLGVVPASGVLVFPARIPTFWVSGDTYYLQALVKWFAPLNHEYLSNLMTLTVE